MRRVVMTLLTIIFMLTFPLFSTGGSLPTQETVSARRLGELLRQNEGFRAEIEHLRQQLQEIQTAVGNLSTRLEAQGVEPTRSELNRVTLSHGDAGLMTLLRLEKVRLFREAGMLDEAVQELRRIIEQNLSEETTNAARWTLIEILQQQNKSREALAQLNKILSTIKDPQKKRDALYGIISLSGRDPRKKIEAIDSLIEKLGKEAIKEPSSPAEPGLINLDPYVTWLLRDLHKSPKMLILHWSRANTALVRRTSWSEMESFSLRGRFSRTRRRRWKGLELG